ncbi:prolipoprotein diacylglyceryl transferase [Rhodobacteraceae bacterium HSP-20]|uniref:Phosphatidylglycerol--prolipoprotein diacylglyceryl transferase n=1 Tax=Paragemmobacter amnigenus TaxID=2852097 RepID=A0ABS6J2R4_9RHOB|nr:prolipoprotein diacylglyceryl transferase [Rhodobacter amnigenus]MBU9698048.1 prolipoprotein diacylglyceryl transferase [Rhodobacter amnigenus]MBV4389275.1 prolipoprotein diacylglyceryl transferase [Rhodobacter amnigenus]
MIPFPDISPEIFRIDLGGFSFALRWYALAYIVGLVAGWKLIARLVSTPRLWPAGAPMTPAQVESLLTWVILGVVLGGRLGFVVFYQPAYYMQNPGHILRVWEGGMSFHGGFLGVVVAGIAFCRLNRIPMLPLADLMAIVAPIGIGLGRLANFINAELWGRPTTLPWGVIFPGEAAQTCPGVVGLCARHPSQLYEAALEGALLFAALLYVTYRKGWLSTPGRIAGLFFAGYGAARFAVEFVRQPDAQFVTEGNPLGLAVHVAGYGLTMGQILSLPMILAGLWFITRARRQTAPA